MGRFNEILNSSNPSDALLGEQIDKLEKKIEILVGLLDSAQMAQYLKLLSQI